MRSIKFSDEKNSILLDNTETSLIKKDDFQPLNKNLDISQIKHFLSKCYLAQRIFNFQDNRSETENILRFKFSLKNLNLEFLVNNVQL